MTANEDLLDATIRRQISMIRVADGLKIEMWELLDASEREVRISILELSRGAAVATEGGARSIARMQRLLEHIREVRAEAWAKVSAAARKGVTDIAVAEAAWIAGAVKTVSPTVLDLNVPSARTLRVRASTKPFLGQTLTEWLKATKVADQARIHRAITVGVTNGDTSRQIASRVVGTTMANGANGATQLTRNQIESLARTANSHATTEARSAFYEANDDIIDMLLFVATLDSRTTAICRSLDGSQYEQDSPDRPVLPLHFGERSIEVPALDAEPIGDRPMKPVTEQQMLREYAAANDISPVPRTRAALPHGTKGKFDSFSRGRVRELTGVVPAKTNYTDFLNRQSAANQDDILGKTKGKLFRNGDVTLDKFVNRDGSEKTLDELARDNPGSFRSAGLDPEDFFE